MRSNAPTFVRIPYTAGIAGFRSILTMPNPRL
jgi:hypothetical protein